MLYQKVDTVQTQWELFIYQGQNEVISNLGASKVNLTSCNSKQFKSGFLGGNFGRENTREVK